MKKFLFFTLMLCFVAFSAEAKKPQTLRYEMECAGNGTQGTYLVKVWVYSKSNLTSDDVKRYAVHGVIFKGYAGKTGGCVAQKAMTPVTAEHQHADFFNAFFNKDKAYGRYATEIQGSFERVRVGKEYKYGLTVSVAKDALRKTLEDAGIIRGLSGGF